MRNNIIEYGPLEKYVEDSVRRDFLQKINETVDWLYGDGQNAPQEQFLKRLNEFKKIG